MAIQMTGALSKHIFSDEIVKATDLNRKSGAILSKAAQSPITIVRNDEYFTLMRRDDIADIVAESAIAKNVVEILNTAFKLSISLEGNPTANGEYGWMRAFDREEIQELVTEVSEAYHCAAFEPNGWENLRAVIHEWHESAIAILSTDLKEAWQSPDEEEPLASPA